jgi:hypothetical protein
MLPALDLAEQAEDLGQPAGPTVAGLFDVQVRW